MKKLLFLCLLITGCASGPSGPPTFTIAIESDPPGARIEVAGEYVGVAPVTYTIRGNADRSFNGSWVQQSNIVFTATPPHGIDGLYVQKKSFTPSAFFKQGDHIPERILFDMHQPAT